jgi:anti-anti-sigma factor
MLAPPRPLIDMTVVWNGFRWRIVVRGELDLRSGQELMDVVGVLASGDLVVVDIDLADVTFIDSAGWEAVTTARRLIEATGGACAVAAAGPAVHRYLDLVIGCLAESRSMSDLTRSAASAESTAHACLD